MATGEPAHIVVEGKGASSVLRDIDSAAMLLIR